MPSKALPRMSPYILYFLFDFLNFWFLFLSRYKHKAKNIAKNETEDDTHDLKDVFEFHDFI
mgnify:CR=1 FL=1